MMFTEDSYEDFINIELNQKNLDYFDKLYLNGEMEFSSKEIEFEFLYSLSKHFIDFYSTDKNKIQNVLFLKHDEYYKPIFYALKSIEVFQTNSVSFSSVEYIKRAYVNLGNYYANQYRVYEAFHSYNCALFYDTIFNMAVGNRLLAFEKTGCLGFYINKQKLFYYLADEYDVLDTKNMEEGSSFFYYKKKHYQNMLNKSIRDYQKGKIENPIQALDILLESELGDSYKEWCLKNRLYINPLNDMEIAIEAAQDIFVDIGLSLNEKQLALLGELYKEYLYYREKIFNNKAISNDNELREMTSAFKSLFSLFDKIAYFLFMFFDLDIKEKDVTYLRVFDGKTQTKSGINLLDIHNTNLYALFWIKREYRVDNDKLDMHKYLSKETQHLNAIRTKLEHRTSLLDNEEKSDLTNKAIGLLKILRRALLYLNALVFQEGNPSLYISGKRSTDLVPLPLINGQHLFN